MSISIAQTIGVTARATVSSSQSSAFGSAVSGSNTILIFFAIEDISAGSGVPVSVKGGPTGNATADSYTQDANAINSIDRCYAYRCSAPTTGSGYTITITVAGNSFVTILGAAEVAGLATVSPLDGAGSINTGTANVAQPNTGAFTTTNAADLLIAVFGIAGITTGTTVGLPSGFLLIAKEESSGSFEDGISTYQIVSATQSNINPTWSGVPGSGRWDAIGLAYKAAGGGTTYTLNVGGSSTPAGAMERQVLKSVGGSSTPAVALAKQAGKPLTGSATAAGALARMTAKSLAGTSTPAGTVAKSVAKPFAGSSTPAGSINVLRVVALTFNGTMMATGSLTRTVGKGIGGAVGAAGACVRAVGKLLAGACRVVGSLVTTGGSEPAADYPIVLFTPDYPQTQLYTPDFAQTQLFTPDAPE